MEWRKTTLQENFDIAWGSTSITKKSYVPSGFTAYSAAGADGYLPDYEHDGAGVILSAIGARCGKCFYATGKWTAIKNTITLLPKGGSMVDPKYAWYFLNDESKWLTKGMGQPFITQKRAQEMELPVPFSNGKPDLVEQKRIADELDGVFLFKETTAKDTAKAHTLISSISNDRFSPSRDAERTVALKTICDITKGSSPTLKTKHGKYPFVVTAAERKSADHYQFDDEAVCIPLVSSTGHGHASLHRLHYQEGRFALANIMVALMAKDREEVSMKYLYYYLSHYRNELFVPLMRGVANVTIPLGSIGDVQVNLPDMTEQMRVVAIFDEAEKLKTALIRRDALVNQFTRSVVHETFATQP